METIGFIGLGNMGAGMAANIQKAGYPLVVLDVRVEAMRPFVERGARQAASPADVARRSDVIFTSLPGPRDVEAVATTRDGILAGIRSGGMYLDLSTCGPSLIRRLAPLFRQKGASALDAPVSGGKTGAASGKLAVMVGGDRADYDRVKPVLDAFADNVFYAGDTGAGSVCKLAHNMVYHIMRQALAEGFTLGVKAGVAPEVLWECMRRGAVGHMLLLHEGLPSTVFKGRFEPPSMFLSAGRKDIALATELGHEYDVPLPMANIAEEIASRALARGWGDKDLGIVFCLQEEAAGVQVRAPGIDVQRAARVVATNPGAG